MPCYSPIKAFDLGLKSNGLRYICFNDTEIRQLKGASYQAFISNPENIVSLPCRKCVGCRSDYRRDWACRCMHEASLHAENCFVTLTYSDDNLPNNAGLDKTHYQKFFKKLRKQQNGGIRYYLCGEYGSLTHRPHYHAILFGYCPRDLILLDDQSRNEHVLYYSTSLEKTWGHGFVSIGDVNHNTCSYVAGYIMKKRIKGKKHRAKEGVPLTEQQIVENNELTNYAFFDEQTGEIKYVPNEFTACSTSPGIGRSYFDKYYREIYNADSVLYKNKELKPPTYYDKCYRQIDLDDYNKIKLNRVNESERYAADSTPERLKVRNEVAESRHITLNSRGKKL